MIPAEEQAQRQAALRALLAKPLLVAADDAESLMLVRRHLPALSGWLRRETGWRLVADAEFGSATAKLMERREAYQARLAHTLESIKPSFNEEMRSGLTNM